VVGAFESGNGLQGSMLADATTLMSAYGRAPFSSVTVRLESPASFDAFKAALTSDPTLSVDALREVDYYSRLSEDLSEPLTAVSYVIGAIMGIGALFGALNTLYTTVSNRRIEIATLRAIGFGAGGVVASVLVEAMILAVAGGLVGAAIAWALLSGNTFSLGGDAGSVVANLRVTPQLLVTGLVWACVLGLVGGLLPAIRAARMPIVSALKAE
jgi:putative ABC transport system permease protein